MKFYTMKLWKKERSLEKLKININYHYPLVKVLHYSRRRGRFNKRHLQFYLHRRLFIGREYNFRIRRTLLISNVFKDSVTDQRFITGIRNSLYSTGFLLFLFRH